MASAGYGKMPMRFASGWYRESVRKFFSRGFTKRVWAPVSRFDVDLRYGNTGGHVPDPRAACGDGASSLPPTARSSRPAYDIGGASASQGILGIQDIISAWTATPC